jgi:hypothetical protein
VWHTDVFLLLHVQNELLDVFLRVNLTGMRVLVIGSEQPWVEVLALLAGAKEVVTLEYSLIAVQGVPQLTTFTPKQFASLYLSGDMAPFDAIASYSSIEHSGLGRYGDALNPWGDIIAVAKAWCVTKPRGVMIIQVPYSNVDSILFNAHRTYGQLRTPFLMTNWVQKFSNVSGPTSARVYERLQ